MIFQPKDNVDIFENLIKNKLSNTLMEYYEKEEKYLQDYLATIRKKDNSYKRVSLSPLRYAGGC
jgi:hypothetical protein